MTLEKYQKKRNFSKTSEPKGYNQQIRKNIQEKDLIFVIHDHYSRNHHHDLRLEVDGVLSSWALPKLTPLHKGEKHLAIEVEDHPLEYANFEGDIPDGEYGAGKVEIFDKGKYKVFTKTKDLIDLEFFGKKVHGNYVLIRLKKSFKFPNKSEKNNWLFFKK